MRILRFYVKIDQINIQEYIDLPIDTSHYISRVLRLNPGDIIHLFNGKSQKEYISEIKSISKKNVQVMINDSLEIQNESPIKINIVQALSKGDKIDTVIQKITELGATSFTPIITDYCDYKLSADRQEKKSQHWTKIAISATEQSGRVIPTKIKSLTTLDGWLNQNNGNCIILHPHSRNKLKDLLLQIPPTTSSTNISEISIIIGPEGGFSKSEISLANKYDCKDISLGPRILRTETTPIAITSILQSIYGDL
jgi:16S rRNA (uracil1498-N3)-methyltransferase